MEMVYRLLFFLAFVNTIMMQDDYDYGLQVDILSNRLQSLSISLAKVQRKQKAMEKRLSGAQSNDNNECCKELLQSIENIKEERMAENVNTGDYEAIKKAITSEKEHARNWMLSLEQTLENKGVILPKSLDKSGNYTILDKKIKRQTEITSDLSKQLQMLGKTINSVQAKTNDFEERIQTIGIISEGYDKQIKAMKSSISSLVLLSNKKVSFSAQYKPPDGHVASIFEKGKAIPFRQVSYNDGAGLNESTGIFTVPVAGVYQFIFFVESWHQGHSFICQDAIVALYVDGKSASAAVADPRHDKQFATGGNTYINYFSKGQQVLVGTAVTCEQSIIFGYRTTFSGILLY